MSKRIEDQSDTTSVKRGFRRQDSGSSLISGVSVAGQNMNMLDSNRIEKLLQTFKGINSAKKFSDMMILCLREFKHLLSYANCTIFVLSKPMVDNLMGLKDQVLQGALMIEGKNCKALSAGDQIAPPCFTKLEEIRYGIKS